MKSRYRVRELEDSMKNFSPFMVLSNKLTYLKG
jgi:hypothetical protein